MCISACISTYQNCVFLFDTNVRFVCGYAAGDNWRQIMNDCKNQAPFCTMNPGVGVPSDCGFKIGATFYFVAYILFAAYLIMSLFMSSVAQYVSYNLLVNGAAALSLSDLHHFRVRPTWERKPSLTIPQSLNLNMVRCWIACTSNSDLITKLRLHNEDV